MTFTIKMEHGWSKPQTYLGATNVPTVRLFDRIAKRTLSPIIAGERSDEGKRATLVIAGASPGYSGKQFQAIGNAIDELATALFKELPKPGKDDKGAPTSSTAPSSPDP